MRVVNDEPDDTALAYEPLSQALAQLVQVGSLSYAELGRRLTQASADLGVGRGHRPTRYDAAAVQRWLTGRQPMSRQAAWLLDQIYPGFDGGPFQDLRDRYILAKDRAAAPGHDATVSPLILQGARCVTDHVASALERRPMPLAAGERLAYIFLAVVDNDESRTIVRTATESMTGVTILAMYDLLGRWDLGLVVALAEDVDVDVYETAVRQGLVDAEMASAAEEEALDPDPVGEARQREFTAQRTIVVAASTPIRDPSGPPRHLVLPDNEQYGLLRVQRSQLFVELETVAVPRRENLRDRLIAALRGGRETFADIVEAVHVGETAIIIDTVATCAQRTRLNELNRAIEEALSRFLAQKYNLLVYFSDESGWIARYR